ncbi:hypothetical protein P8C59_004526 [Phyllachora maydis]|uniref:Uncharacterized protein n=1 Tax=Phyllachora maydis TaxID=1825666 RepID=A0AAD9I3T7_9PEZI|nr:hypothetical protein P8C59_004526 [Phyllachora maydis]
MCVSEYRVVPINPWWHVVSPYQYNDGFMSAAWRPITCYGRRPEVALAEWDPLPRTFQSRLPHSTDVVCWTVMFYSTILIFALVPVAKCLVASTAPARNWAPTCSQVFCDVSVCAVDSDDAHQVASRGLVALMGPDCGDWVNNSPQDNGQGPCAAGLKIFTGKFEVWRGWVMPWGDMYRGTFAQWGNFLGATCVGGKEVKCKSKHGIFPNSGTGLCQGRPDS